VDLSALGRSAGEIRQLAIPAAAMDGTTLSGEVLRIDRFGNLVTNIDRRLFDKFAQSGAIEIDAGGHRVGKVVATYAEADGGEVCALFGSSDHLEIAVNAGSASDQLHLARGAAVTIRHT
jgi:S-adenosylmethionine hydrolase